MARFMAFFIGSVSASEKAQYTPTAEEEAAWARGVQAWGAWMEKHADAIIDGGGPLGKTLRVSSAGVSSHENQIVGYALIEADSHEAAAAMFEDHPHFRIMPGDSVEVLECLSLSTSD